MEIISNASASPTIVNLNGHANVVIVPALTPGGLVLLAVLMGLGARLKGLGDRPNRTDAGLIS